MAPPAVTLPVIPINVNHFQSYLIVTAILMTVYD
jgi:hypothetical protein